jgi:NAD(P)-dependent dehydrogenase (short-subunit alcohol dehydrogenase family)
VEIKDAVAVVTGGASGLGLATTKALLDEGAKVVILDLPTSKGEDVAKDLNAEFGADRAAFAAADVTDEEAVTKAFDLAETMGPVRIVVNCAGTGDAIRVLGKSGVYPLNKFARIVNINLVGTFNVLRLGAERMVKTESIGGERGVIINTASVAAFDGQIGQAAYSASKGGVVGMTLPIARDLAAVGVRVNTVAPGLIDTPIYGQGDASEAFKSNLQKGVLFPQRLGFQEELASMVVECVTNSYMNAETIRVDGGIRMPPK